MNLKRNHYLYNIERLFIVRLPIPLYPINKLLFGNVKKIAYICITKRNEDVFIYDKKKNINVLFRSKKKYLEISKTICIFVSTNENKIIMAIFKNNAELENGMFDAAQLKNETIIINNGTITFYHRVYAEHGTEWLSFNVDDAHDCGEVVEIMHNAANGIDLVVDGKFIGYFKWSNNFADRYVGWKLFTDNGDKIAEMECGMKRYSENAKYTVAVYMYDYIKENYIDPVDAAVAAWGEKNPEEYNTIEYNTDDEYFNVWVGEFFFQMDGKLTGDWATDYHNVREYLEDTLGYELGSALECEADEIIYNETWDEALEVAENYMTLSDAWELGFTVETFLKDWAENNIDRILSDDWRNFGDPSRFRVPVELDGKRANYDYPVDDFRGDVRYYINNNVEKTLKNPDRYASIIANYLYDVWNEDFSIFFTGRYRYDEDEGAIYDNEHHEPTDEEKRRDAEIAEYCRSYGYENAAVYFEYHDTDTTDDFVLLPMLGEVPDGFYDAFGEDATWDDEAMYMGMADYLNEGDERRWRVECDGYRVYGYTIDTDPSDTLDAMRKKHGAAVGHLINSVA